MMRAKWAHRILFLADRRSLVKQAANAFTAHLPWSSPVNLLADHEATGRVPDGSLDLFDGKLVNRQKMAEILQCAPGLVRYVPVDHYRHIGSKDNLPASNELHEISIEEPRVHEGRTYFMVRLRLFANLGAPAYIIAAGTPN